MIQNQVFIPNRIYFRIGDVAEILGVKPYVIRFWETEFPFVAPEKASSGQRVYRRAQIEGLVLVKHLLHVERYSIEGAKKKLTELRKSAKLKESMLVLVRGGDEPPVDAPFAVGSVAVGSVAVGSVVAKDQVASLNDHPQGKSPSGDAHFDSLREKIETLQNLIRDPKVNGEKIPGLKLIKK